MSAINDLHPCLSQPIRTRSLLLLAVTSLLMTGCVSTQLEPISVQGAAYQPLPDEIDLWQAAREEESLMLGQVEVYDDPALERYLDQLITRLQPSGMAANREVRFRVTVLDDPTVHAFAYPHGSIYIHSGLLAETDWEDQIAAVLAHEMTHVENRHMARHERARWNHMAPIGVLSIGFALALAADEIDALEAGNCEEAALLEEMEDDVLNFGFKLASRVSASGYGRRLEREADAGMLDKLRANGYNVDVVLAFYDRIAGLEDSRRPLAHSLGSDMTRRLRALAKSTGPLDTSTAGGQPIATPSDLAHLLAAVKKP